MAPFCFSLIQTRCRSLTSRTPSRAWIKNRRGRLTPVSDASSKSQAGKLSEFSDARSDGTVPQHPKNQPLPAAHSARELSPLDQQAAASLTGESHPRLTFALTSRSEMGNAHLPPTSHPSPESKTARDQSTPEQRLSRVFSL